MPPLLSHGLFPPANTCEISHILVRSEANCLTQDDKAVLHVSVGGAKPPKPNETRCETTGPAPCPLQCVVTSSVCASSGKTKGVNPISELGLAQRPAFHTSLIPLASPNLSQPDHLTATDPSAPLTLTGSIVPDTEQTLGKNSGTW